MSRSKHAVELCALLVDEIYGELTSRIFTILLRRGRLQIYQLCAHTRLTKRQIQHGLAVLIQQNLIYHCNDQLDDRTYYEANHDAAYALVRTGKIVELVASRFGVLAREVMENILLLGHAKASDLADAIQPPNEPHTNGDTNGHPGTNSVNGVNGINGKAKTHVPAAGQIDHILAQLLQSGFIEPVTEQTFRSPTDAHDIVENKLLRNNYAGQTKGTRQKEELKEKVRGQLKSLRDESRSWKPTGNKRSNDLVSGVNGQGKKRRHSRSEAPVNGDHAVQDEGFRLDRNLVVRVNYEKCTVALRNQRLVQLASSRIGETTAQVYAELLKLLEENIPRCRLDPTIDDIDDLPDGPAVTTTELSQALSKSIKVWKGIGDPTHQTDLRRPDKPLRGKKVIADEAEVEGEASEDEDESDEDAEINGTGNIPEVDEDSAGDGDDPFAEEDPRPAKRAKVTFQEKLPKPKSKLDTLENREMRSFHIKMHLQLLAEDSCKFIRKCGKSGSNEWTVDFEPLAEHLRELEMDTIFLENFGPNGHRLVRMLRKLGKLEEKALPNLALMKQKDIRTKMAEMQMAGMVDIQEVPRDASRTTARTIFLWYFDPERVSSILLDNVYKAMSRCIQRLEIEKRRASGILAIAERTDVREADEQEVLDESQLRLLVDIRAKEEKLLGQIGRLDELVGVFRDY